MYGLAQTGFSFLDRGLHGETNTFHMPNGQMTVTLDDMCCLLRLPIQGQLLDHASITTKAEGIKMMMEYLGSTQNDVETEVKITKGAHARFLYLRRLIRDYVKVVNRVVTDGNTDTFERYRGYLLRAFLLLFVGTTIFSNKAKNYVDLTYLKFFFDLDRVDSYLWGTVALAFLYRELRNAVVPDCKYVAGYMRLFQAWVYNHFEDIGGTKSKCYVEEMSSACKYELTKGQTNQLAMRKMMGWLLPHDTTWAQYEDHRDVWSFEDIALYSGWIRCGPIRVRYLPERVLRQFGYIETISRHPHAAANPLTTVA